MENSNEFAEYNSKDKAVWELAAQSANLSLSDWVHGTLNEAVLHMHFKPPKWMKFSDRTSQCLLKGGISEECELIALVDSEGWQWRKIPNFGTTCYNEVVAWRQRQK